MHKLITIVISFVLVFGSYLTYALTHGGVNRFHVFILLIIWMSVCYYIVRGYAYRGELVEDTSEMTAKEKVLYYSRAVLFAVRLAIVSLIIALIFLLFAYIIYKNYIPFKFDDVIRLNN